MLTLTLTLSSTLLLIKFSKYFWYHCGTVLLGLLIVSSPSLFSPHLYSLNSPLTGIDFMSATLIILTIWITYLIFQASQSILLKNNNAKIFAATSITLTLILILCFRSSNLLTFYIWFEASLVPTMLLIIVWGYQPERLQARIYLIIYTVTASLPLFLLLCKTHLDSGHLLISYPWILLPESLNPLLAWIIITTAFLVKLPLYLVHLWLPKAHVEAPVAGSIILAAILLKLGGYGLIRAIIIFPDHVHLTFIPISILALMGASISSLICLRQRDIKSLIAYSSVGHIGLMIAGLLSNTQIGLYGGLAIIIAHGLVSSGLFCIANTTYELTKTRRLILIKGLLILLPIISLWWFLLICANIAGPPTINLLSEILLIISSLSRAFILAPLLARISFLTAAYSLFLYSSINHGASLPTASPILPLKPINHLLNLLHFSPSILLIVIPDVLTNWL